MSDIGPSVTDEDIENFFASRPDFKPLAPVNPGADPSAPVEFHSGDGKVVPPTTDEDIEVPAEDAPTVEAPPAGGADPDSTSEPAQSDPTESGHPSTVEIPDFVEFGERRVPASQLSALLELQQNIADDPRLQQLLTDYFVPSATPAEGGAPTTADPAGGAVSPAGLQPPEDLDLEDPTIRGLWTTITSMHDELSQVRNAVGAVHQQSQSQLQAQAVANYNRAAEQFRTEKDLTPEDIKSLTEIAGRLNVVPSLLSGTDPISGTPVKLDPIRAAHRALEIAYYVTPEYRARDFRQTVDTRRQDENRKKNLNAVGGTSGSVPRTQAASKPGTPESKRDMLREVGAMMTGEWSDPASN